MRLSTQWLAASVVLTGILVAAGVVLNGCSPAPEPPARPDIGATPVTPKEPVTAEGEPSPEAASQEPVGEGVKPESVVELPPAPPVSTFAPAEDLVAQVGEYLEDLEEAVETEEEYNDSVEKIAKDSNTLILIALALGLHDTDNQLKGAAPAMLKAAQALARAGDYASAKAAVAAVKEATTSTDEDPAQLQWEKLASLPEIMKAVPLINTRIKRYLRNESRLEKAADDVAGYAAVLAVIAQGSLPNSDETDKPTEVGKWQALCIEMRDRAAAVNTAVRKFGEQPSPDAFEATKAVMEALNKNCEDCHAVFKPDAVISDETE